MGNIFIPNKKTAVIGGLYFLMILGYLLFLVIGIDLFFGTTFLSPVEMNRDALSGAAWIIFMLIFTPIVGLMTNISIDGDEGVDA